MTVKSTMTRREPSAPDAGNGEPEPSAHVGPGWLDASEAVLNAVLGDYLERRGNGLAIEMALHHRGRPIPLTAEALRAARPKAAPRIVVFVHGMAQTEACWSYPDDPAKSYGSELELELGLTPYWVRYNTGRHVSENGRDLGRLLERLIAVHPVPVVELTLIGHSMGGLVIRSACHYAVELGLRWIEVARRAIYLGSPHLGSPLEKGGHLVSVALGAIPHPVVKLTRTLVNLRSAGVKDLRHGSLVDEDWRAQDLDAPGGKRPSEVPLCPGMEHYLVAGTLTREELHFAGRWFGDALVRVPSAIAPGRRAGLADEHFAVLPGLSHMSLAHDPAVCARLRAWCSGSLGRTPPSPAERSLAPPSSDPPPAARDRLDAYRSLLEDAVDRGASAVQQVQEELTARPYDVLAQIPPLEAPAKAVRTAHFALLRTGYGMVRAVNRLAGAALAKALTLRTKSSG